MSAAGPSVATGQFGLTQTEGVRKRRERRRKDRREESQHYCPTEEREKKTEMKWRSGKGGGE